MLYIAQAHLGTLKRTYLDGPADLAVEVVSPESQTRDRQQKFQEYQQGGVREFWLLDPDAQSAAFYQLGAQGAYQQVAPDAQGIYRSAALAGFWLDVAWLWQDPLLDPEMALLQIIGKPYAEYRREQMRRMGL